MHDTKNGPMVVGTKQTLKALQDNLVSKLYIAKNANPDIIKEVLDEAKSKETPIVYVETMEELGKTCEIQVRTATAALINQA